MQLDGNSYLVHLGVRTGQLEHIVKSLVVNKDAETYSITGDEFKQSTSLDVHWRSTTLNNARFSFLYGQIHALQMENLGISDSIATITTNLSSVAGSAATLGLGLKDTLVMLAQTRSGVNDLRREVRRNEWISSTVARLQNQQSDINSALSSEGGIPFVGSEVSSMEQEANNLIFKHIIDYTESMKYESATLAVFPAVMRRRAIDIWHTVDSSHTIESIDNALTAEAVEMRARIANNILYADQFKVALSSGNGEFISMMPKAVAFIERATYSMPDWIGSDNVYVPGDIMINMHLPNEVPFLNPYLGVRDGYFSRRSLYCGIVLHQVEGVFSYVDYYTYVSDDVVNFEDYEMKQTELASKGDYSFDRKKAEVIGTFPLFATLPVIEAIVWLLKEGYADGRSVMSVYKMVVEYLCGMHPQNPCFKLDMPAEAIRTFALKHYTSVSVGDYEFSHHHFHSQNDAIIYSEGNSSDGVLYNTNLGTWLLSANPSDVKSHIQSADSLGYVRGIHKTKASSIVLAATVDSNYAKTESDLVLV
jgi:hypothetical protein